MTRSRVQSDYSRIYSDNIGTMQRLCVRPGCEDCAQIITRAVSTMYVCSSIVSIGYIARVRCIS
eukprot:5096456-Lingulodinium_polyedra.AAC.1